MTESEPVEATPGGIIDEACYEPFRRALADLRSKLENGVIRTLTHGLERHRALVEEAGLEGDAPREWTVRSEHLLEYRRAVAAEILEPMLQAFRGSGPMGSIAIHLSGALEEATRAARDLPSDIEGTWPEDALLRRPTDGLGRKIRKFFARGLSVARKSGRARTVPIRAVALHHLDDTLSSEVDTIATTCTRDWAEWTRGIEHAWMEWADAALPALVRAELPDIESEDDPWSTIREAGQALEVRFTALVNESPLQPLVDAIEGRLDRSREMLESDLGVVGSFVFRPENTHRAVPTLTHLARMAPSLEEWDEAVANRLHLYEALLSILAGTTAVQRRLVWRVRDERLAGAKVLPEVAGTLEQIASTFLARTAEAPKLEDQLRELRTRVEEVLEPASAAIPEPGDVDRTIQRGSSATVDALLSMVHQAPASLEVHEEDGRLPQGTRRIEVRSVALQELARQAFDALRIERIRSSTAGLVGSIDEVRTDIEELPSVFAFAFDAARDELDKGREGEDGVTREEAEERAQALVNEALLSMGESLRNAERSLDAAVRRAHGRLATEVSDGSLGLLNRVAAGRVQAGLLAARSRFAEMRAWIRDRGGPPTESAIRFLQARWTLARRWGSRALRKGTAMVGTGPTTVAESTRTLRALSEADTVITDLPLVYQRLFTFDPISDPTLLAGRDIELANAMERWTRWRSEDGVPLLVGGTPGCGVTSFLRVLGGRIGEDGGDHRRLSLDARVECETDLARLLSAELDLEEAGSLDALAAAILGAPKGSLPDAIAVDNLEHLYLRVPRGTDLIERLLTLMAESEPRIFWIGGITASAWQLITTAEPNAISQVDILKLDQLSADGVREAIRLRHRRSGLPVRFEEPARGRRMLRRRLRRLRDPDAHGNLLADDFFVQLARTSSRNLRLALFQWIVAADFGQNDGVVMRTPQRPDFSMLDSLDLTQNFTLKAFLEHRTLTLDEHDRIFRLPRQESYQIFESLGNRHLIRPVLSDGDDEPARSEIEEELRYRVRPLLVGAVVTHLQSRNIVH